MTNTADGVLVTGAGAGIGAAIARHFGGAGRRVACLDLDGDRAVEVAAAIERSGGDARGFACDVSDETAVAAAVTNAIDWLEGLSTVVSNAGIVLRKSLLDTTVDEWNRTMAVNARGTFLIARATVPHLQGRPNASINMIASVVAHVGFGLPAYTASKGAILALMRELAGELAPLGIRVNAVSPGTVEGTAVTALTLGDPELRRRTLATVPRGRFATPEDVVGAVAYLASPQATMVTGHALVVDGGVSSIAAAMLATTTRS